MDSMSVEKFSNALSEYWMVLSGVVQWLVGILVAVPFLLSLSLRGALLIEAACAVAAEVGEEEVPVIVPKIIGPGIARCLFSLCLLFSDLVSQASPRLAKI